MTIRDTISRISNWFIPIFFSGAKEVQSAFEVQEAIVHIFDASAKMLGIGVLIDNKDVLIHKDRLRSEISPVLNLPGENIPRYTDALCLHGDIIEITVSRKKVPIYSQIR